jgi:trimeric autotransporter adhesin
MGAASNDLYKLRPVTFTWNKKSAPGLVNAPDTRQFGLIAEEVAELFPALVNYEKDGTPLNVKYEYLSALLINEVQKLKKEIETLKKLVG